MRLSRETILMKMIRLGVEYRLTHVACPSAWSLLKKAFCFESLLPDGLDPQKRNKSCANERMVTFSLVAIMIVLRPLRTLNNSTLPSLSFSQTQQCLVIYLKDDEKLGWIEIEPVPLLRCVNIEDVRSFSKIEIR